MTIMGLSQQDFAARLDMTPASISGIYNGRTNPTIKHVMAIHRAFPQINEKWLLYGEGTMISSDGAAPSPTNAPLSPIDQNPISIIDEEEGGSELGGIFSQTQQSGVSTITQQNARVTQQGSSSTQLGVHPTPQTPTPPSNNYRTHTHAREATQNEAKNMAKYIDTPLRRVKEIRVFYDDNTYETFVPAVK